MDQVFIIPGEPIAALLADTSATSSGLISADTMINATFALWQINKINELVRKQAVFNATHAPDFIDSGLTQSRRNAVKTASVLISAELHHDGIGNAGDTWYRRLEQSVDGDLEALQRRGRLWNIAQRNPIELIGDALAIAAMTTVAIAYASTL
jgi:hypothetical protein